MNKCCSICHRELELSCYWVDKKNKDGLFSFCKDCASQSAKERRSKNINKTREQSRAAARRFSQSEKGKAYIKAYKKSETYRDWEREYNKTPDRIKAHKADNAKPERVAQRKEHQASASYKQIRKEYRQSEAGKQVIAACAQRRIARKKGLACDLTARQWRTILKIYDGKCAYCGSKENIEQEHVIPISRGGGTTIENIVPACKKCNMSKKDKTVSEWFFHQSTLLEWERD